MSGTVEVRALEIEGEERAAIWAHAPAAFRFPGVRLAEQPVLRFGVGVRTIPGVRTDGVAFEVLVTTTTAKRRVWRRVLAPLERTADRGWLDVELRLDAWAQQTVDLELVTDPLGDRRGDHAAWSLPFLEGYRGELSLDPSTPIRRRVLVERLDPTALTAASLTVPRAAFLEVAGEIIRPGGDGESRSEAVFRVELGDGDEAGLERRLRAVGKSKSFSARIDLDRLTGRSTDVRFEIDIAEPRPGLEARWLDAGLFREVSLRRQRAPAGPNLLLLVVDTLRSDHLGVYGYDRDTSPTLDRLAREGVLFEQAVSQSSWTMPATASLLTGLYPTEHGVREGQPLGYELDTLAELFQKGGVTTIGISANPLVGAAEGFTQGHEVFVHLPWARAESVNGLLVQLLTAAKSSRWFAYVHYVDPHDPYAAPEPFASSFGPTTSRFADHARFAALVDAVNFGRGSVDYDEQDLRALAAAYDGEIRYWDEELGHLLDALAVMGLLEDTVVVVTSDHGEELLEHGRLKHGPHLYEESIRVPFVVWAPSHLRPARISDQVETRRVFDLAMLVLDSASPLSAPDLAAILAGPRGWAFAHTTHGLPGVGRGRTGLMALRTDRWKVIATPEAGRLQLFDLEADGGELHDLSAERSDLARRYEEVLGRWSKATPSGTSGVVESESMLDELRALGYIQ